MTQDQIRVTARRVFYIPGFDPIHPRRYRELYRREAAAQAAISGYRIGITARPSKGRFHWLVRAQIDAQTTTTQIDILYWADIVRDSMAQSIWATYVQMMRTIWVYLASGALWRLVRLRKGPVIAAFYPVVMLIGQALLGAACGWWLGGMIAAILPQAQFLAQSVIAAIVFCAVLGLFRRYDRWFFAYYLMHDYAFGAQHWGATPPALDARLTEFRDQIAQALHDPVQEVLIVGHSSGAHLAIQVIADLFRRDLVPSDGAKIAFLSLGQVVPMVSFLPRADALRRDLAALAGQERLTWVDVSAPSDGACFALCDPVGVTGVAPVDKKWPLVISAAYRQTLSPQKFKTIRWRFFRAHFQYLCAFDRPKDYDYFQITAGPVLLADRFRGRTASKSRVTRPLSLYRGQAADG
jgi:hypothetical protein